MIERIGLAAIALLLLAPAFLNYHGHHSLPEIWQGDQPHYLVMLNSLISDGDLDLGNNYSNAHNGGLDSGKEFRGLGSVDHHSVYLKNARRILWCEVYDCNPDHWALDEAERVTPLRRAGSTEDLSGLREMPWHPAGLPLLLAPFTWPFRGTRWVEPVAVLLCELAMITAMLLFHALVRGYTMDRRWALVITALTFLGTPAWHYSRMLFVEGFLLLFTVGAYYFALRRQNYLLAGVLIALGILMKPPFALIAIPLALHNRRALFQLAVPIAAGVIATLGLNAWLYGSPWTNGIAFQWGNPFDSAPRMLFGMHHGLLPFAPILIAAAIGWPAMLRSARADARTLIGCAAIYFAFMSFWAVWTGGWCYGPRLLLPAIPLLMIGLVGVWPLTPRTRALVCVLGAASIAINAVGAFRYSLVYDTHPLLVAFHQ